MDSPHHSLQAALTQVLENFQRCGLTRFAALSADQLPAPWLARLSELAAQPLSPQASQPVATQATATPAAPSTVRHPASPVAEDASPGVQIQPRWSAAAEDRSTPPASPRAASIPQPASGGIKVGQPWSLPLLSTDERHQRFTSLAEQIRQCRQCTAIVDHRQQTVFGEGHLQPRVCFLGEAPGADEDRTGRPFVGKAGQLLTRIIEAMKLTREQVYILNALKCRPPQNRTPVNEEIDYCRAYVETQLDILQPQFIVCLGAVAVRSLLRQEMPIGRLRGRFHEYRGAQVVVTYHPSYLLRNESAKRLVWEDMKMLMARLPSPAS